MTNKYYQNNGRIRKEAHKKYQNLSEEEKDKRRKKVPERYKIFLRNKSRSYLSK